MKAIPLHCGQRMIELGYTVRCEKCGRTDSFTPGRWHEVALQLTAFPSHCGVVMSLARKEGCQVCGTQLDEILLPA
jgi:hypothetical protein